MLDRFPPEILQRICGYLDTEFDKKYPEHTFRYPSKLVRPLSQVSHSIKDALAPFFYKHSSLVRVQEFDGPQSTRSRNAGSWINDHRSCLNHIREVEVPSSLPLHQLHGMNNLKSVTILGDNNIEFGDDIYLEHIALVLPREMFQISGLKRLDILIDPRLIEYLDGLESFNHCPLEELNVTIRDFAAIVKYKPFLRFLLSFKSTLRKFSLRSSNQLQPSSLKVPMSDILPSTTQFFKILNQHSLTHLSLDLLLMRLHTVIPNAFDLASPPKPLHVSIVEPSLAGPLTRQQKDDILIFLSQLSSYSIHTLNFIHGIQTELPFNTVLQIMIELLTDIHKGEDYKSLRSIWKVQSLLAWHIIDDSIYMDYREKKKLLSFETSDGLFVPGYRMRENYDVKVTTNSIFAVRSSTLSEIDYDFWSRECISTVLLRFSKYKRSSLWD